MDKAPNGLEKCPSGIEGLDGILAGGLPRGRPTLVCGNAGCGKTLLGMAFLVHGAVDHGEPGVFVTFGESGPDLARNFAIPDPREDTTQVWELRLYVAGQTPRSLVAFANLKRIAEQRLAGRYRIEVIDLMAQPRFADDDQILAVPTLVRRFPPPSRKILGDLSDEARTLAGLGLLALPLPGAPGPP